MNTDVAPAMPDSRRRAAVFFVRGRGFSGAAAPRASRSAAAASTAGDGRGGAGVRSTLRLRRLGFL
ncbi:MAG TPA: hypothetical protein VJ696_06030, partial [Rhodanobacteraceae bacterium]|nr:hypothetical protein [Rhodanobacteraceae bacterium]